MRIDLHVHLAGIGDPATASSSPSGCFVSRRMTRSITYFALRQALGIATDDPLAATEAYANRLVALVDASRELDYACIFAMDGVYDASGALVPSDSHLYVPNGYVFDVCRRSPKTLPVISVNPQRHDAIAELQRWGDRAIALKWLGPLQKFDASDKAYERFYDALAELRLPVIAHSGCEHTFPGMMQHLGNPALYEPLARRGIPIVFSHCGTGSFLAPGHDYSHEFVTLLERYEHVYGDTSAFCSLVRWKQLKRFGADRYVERIFHGSDWPIPSSAIFFLADLGFNRVVGLHAERHALDRDVLTKRAMGLPDGVFHGAYALLRSRIEAWEAVRTRT